MSPPDNSLPLSVHVQRPGRDVIRTELFVILASPDDGGLQLVLPDLIVELGNFERVQLALLIAKAETLGAVYDIAAKLGIEPTLANHPMFDGIRPMVRSQPARCTLGHDGPCDLPPT